MAIRVLMDHGVPQENIIFLTFIVAACGGVRVLQRAFPKVRIICGAVDPILRESWALWDTTGSQPRAADEETPTPTVQTRAEAEEEGRKVWVVEPGMGHIGERSVGVSWTGVLTRLLRRRSVLPLVFPRRECSRY